MLTKPDVSESAEFNKYFPPGLTLETSRVVLSPMQKEDAVPFSLITPSKFLWKFFTKELDDELQLAQWIDDALNDRAAGRRMPFTVRDKQSGLICGSTSLGSISFYDKRIEIGWSWLGEASLGSGVNRHCKFILLQYAFEIMQFIRVEIKTDNLNERAKQALRKIGAVEEGVLRSHMQMPQNRRRDSIYFSILNTEWEDIKQRYFNEITGN